MSPKSFNPEELPDLSGKVIVVTGGNAGVGYAVIQHLARRGAKVYMAARSQERAVAAIDRLRSSGLGPGNGDIHWLPLDYSDPRLAKQAAEVLMEKEARLDIVVNCAALLLIPYKKSHDGIQDIVMVNYLSPTVFIRALLPLLERTAQEPNSDVRIVEVLSEGHRNAPKGVRFRNIDDFNAEFKDASFQRLARYGLSKFMGMLHVKELQRRLDEEGVPIIVLSVHPGVVNTEGVQAYTHSVGPVLSPIYTFIANSFFSTPSQGAYGPVFAAAAPVVRAEAQRYRGAYILPPSKLARADKRTEDRELAKELWDTTESILSGIGL
ncbi:NAD(P)-binding protein [Wolfiporia cocos MD-104 SS10]|uniref:NAD(P)-binding protein n=1 Tax=Wolfiporia cocos (strain MD-104) TaxID=742152 RepID=A0A2H3JAA5_WOLCO|nr:NAD(P)-binding protein [Wolfiporia cocos MD-104 SS10]